MGQLNLDSWKGIINALAVIAILLTMFVLVLLIGRSANGTYNAGIILAMILDGLLIVLLIVGILVVRHASRQRVLACRNGQEVLVATQPIADENALPLPTTIELRVNKAKYILFQAIFFALLSSITAPLTESQGPLSPRHFLLTFLIALPAGGLGGLLNFYLR